MKMNPELAEKPDCGHYDACCTRMLEIKRFSRILFIYSAVSGLILIFFTCICFYLGPFSLIPSRFGAITDTEYIIAQSLIILSIIGLNGWGYAGKKICHVIVFAMYTFLLLASFFLGTKALLNFGTVCVAVGVLLSFKAFGCYADYEQLYRTEGFPYFSRLFEEKVDTSYKSFYEEQYKKLPKNPERRFGDVAPLPKTPEQEMQDLSAAPMEKTVKGHSSEDDGGRKSFFEEV